MQYTFEKNLLRPLSTRLETCTEYTLNTYWGRRGFNVFYNRYSNFLEFIYRAVLILNFMSIPRMVKRVKILTRFNTTEETSTIVKVFFYIDDNIIDYFTCYDMSKYTTQ